MLGIDYFHNTRFSMDDVIVEQGKEIKFENCWKVRGPFQGKKCLYYYNLTRLNSKGKETMTYISITEKNEHHYKSVKRIYPELFI